VCASVSIGERQPSNSGHTLHGSILFSHMNNAASISLFVARQIPISIPWAIDVDWISRAEVLETSALSCGLSLARSLVKSVASWLAREMAT